MLEQDHYWSRIAASYEKEFIDPHRDDVRSPLLKALRTLARRGAQTVADLGCGIGPLLPFLAQHFPRVHAVDFAPGMLDRAKSRVGGHGPITFHQTALTDLSVLHGQLDAAISVNSLVQPHLDDLEKSLDQIRRTLKPGGYFLGILPAMDAVHYFTMVLLDRARGLGMPEDAARKNAAHHAEHSLHDFAFGGFHYQGLEQHFWQPFEIRHRLERAGFRPRQLRKVHLSWKQFARGAELKHLPPPWDWFFLARADPIRAEPPGSRHV